MTRPLATSDAFKDIEKLEADLWAAADNLRANSKLTSSDYFMPVLGIIFLRHAANRFESIDAMEGRILSFNNATAHTWADHKHLFEQAGQPMPVEDSYIASAARRHGLVIVTGNDKDFRRPGVKVFNPFKELAKE